MKRMFLLSLSIIAILNASSQPSFAQFDWFKKKAQEFKSNQFETLKETTLSETEIGAGLKEALKVGINNAVASTSRPGGYFDNENIKILMPQKLQFFDKSLRKLGYGQVIDNFVLSMNKAAESAAPAAQDIFLDALFEMSFEDAKKLLQGGDTAATDYFKKKTYDDLAQAFQPTIDKALQKYDVTDKYNDLISKYQTIPFAGKIKMLSPDDYVINQALDGLFTVLGQEEMKIRENPAARVTDVLQKVFK